MRADVANGSVRDAVAEGLAADVNLFLQGRAGLAKVDASRPLYLAPIQLPA
ncbi:hypothetical protein PDR5_48230 [Pseudomonas sp. DR 5-09]|nr:hypothetical protein PDR5_48230 [Pseudomonas sp. DR 5-09]